MPRGVSQRKGAPAINKQAPVKPSDEQLPDDLLAPVADVQAPPPSLSEPDVPAVPDDAAPEPAPAKPTNIRNRRGSVEDMPIPELQRYARSIGISQRNVDFLTPERLRQNCKAKIFESMED